MLIRSAIVPWTAGSIPLEEARKSDLSSESDEHIIGAHDRCHILRNTTGKHRPCYDCRHTLVRNLPRQIHRNYYSSARELTSKGVRHGLELRSSPVHCSENIARDTTAMAFDSGSSVPGGLVRLSKPFQASYQPICIPQRRSHVCDTKLISPYPTERTRDSRGHASRRHLARQRIGDTNDAP